ncbi:MAG: periplasmic heavy metal sensor [Parvibaculaceae bacterium]|nr:periplasmic heavy metal sensor [Parvibaculaceae bacterium]
MSVTSPVPPETTGQARPPARWIRLVLFASLLLNLFLAGVIGVSVVRHLNGRDKPDDDGPPIPGIGMLHDGSSSLPLLEQKKLRKVMRDSFPAIRPYLKAVMDARRNLADAIAVEPFNPDGVRAGLEAIDKSVADVTRASQDAIIGGLSQLTPQDRAIIADRLRKPPEKFRFKVPAGDGPGPRDDGPKDDGPPPSEPPSNP